MKYRIVRHESGLHSEPSLESDSDTQLSQALLGTPDTIALMLPEKTFSGVDFLDWLSHWQRKISRAGKRFVIITANAQQHEFLEFSDLDRNLEYARSLSDVGLQAENSQEQIDENTGVVELNDSPCAESKEEGPGVPGIMEGEDVKEVQPQRSECRVYEPKSGEIAAYTGEFTCNSCKTTRMWLKGDTILNCDNLECLDDKATWSMVFELF